MSEQFDLSRAGAFCASSKPHVPQKSYHFRPPPATVVGMHTTIMILVATLRETFPSRASLHLENLALRQQVAILKRERRRPWLQTLDRLFWAILFQIACPRHSALPTLNVAPGTSGPARAGHRDSARAPTTSAKVAMRRMAPRLSD